MPGQVAAEVWAYTSRSLNVQSAVLVSINPACETGAAVAKIDPGTTYVTMADRLVCLPYSPGKKGKLILTSFFGTEAGAGKGIRLRNYTDSVTLAEKTWDGSLTQWHWESAEFTFPADGKNLIIECKGSSATEDISVANIYMLIY